MNTAPDLNSLFSEAYVEYFQAGTRRIESRSIAIDLDEGSAIVEQSILEVTRRGDLICMREIPLEYIRVSDGPNPSFVSATSSDPFRLCLLQECTFADSLNLIDQLSFYPDQSKAQVFGESWALTTVRARRLLAIKDFLREIRLSQEIAIAQYFETSILVRQLGKDSGAWRELSKRILEFNRDILGAKLSKSQITEYVEQFTQFRFFVVSSGA